MPFLLNFFLNHLTGMKFTDQKCQDWFISLFISMSVNVLLSQTLQFVFSYFFKFHDHDLLVDEHIFLAANSTKVRTIFLNTVILSSLITLR
jgi:hypothetical protein